MLFSENVFESCISASNGIYLLKFSRFALYLSFNLVLCAIHSSEIGGLHLMKCSSETPQNLSYWNTNPHLVFFISCYIIFPPNECLVYVDILLIQYEKNEAARNEKQNKTTWDFVFQKFANFEEFHSNFSSSINLSFLNSDQIRPIFFLLWKKMP